MKATPWLLLALLWALPAGAADLHIASAANFRSTLELLLVEFGSANHNIAVSYASTGVLYAQIRHGAPFDLMLAADIATPARIADEGLGQAATRHTYARGELVLVYQPHLAELANAGLQTLLSRPQLTLAVANPLLAPYGRAAASVVARLPQANRPQLITGSNILQTYQLWYSGGVDTALVARALASAEFLEIPAHWYEPIDQQAILLRPGYAKPLATAFLTFLASDRALHIIRSDGYLTPGADNE